LQVRYQENNGADQWKTVEETVHWQPAETAIIICDMWDRHWCDGATQRVAGMAPRMNETIRAARARGVTIIHAPSSVMDFYADQPGRIRMQQAPPATPPEPFKDWYDPKPGTEPDLPIDDSDGGCDTCGNGPCTNVNQSVWTRQIETLDIADEDGISDDGPEIHNYLRHKGIKNVIIMGVHTNMCVLGRPFGIRAQRTMGMNVLLARDLTDAMYNPGMAPYVSHDEGTHRVIDHIEKYWGPTVLSDDLIKPGGH
jgi:nicotinamidase-related amidase